MAEMQTPPNIVRLKKVSETKYTVTIFDGSTMDFKTEEDARTGAEAALKAILSTVKGGKVGIIDYE